MSYISSDNADQQSRVRYQADESASRSFPPQPTFRAAHSKQHDRFSLHVLWESAHEQTQTIRRSHEHPYYQVCGATPYTTQGYPLHTPPPPPLPSSMATMRHDYPSRTQALHILPPHLPPPSTNHSTMVTWSEFVGRQPSLTSLASAPRTHCGAAPSRTPSSTIHEQPPL